MGKMIMYASVQPPELSSPCVALHCPSFRISSCCLSLRLSLCIFCAVQPEHRGLLIHTQLLDDSQPAGPNSFDLTTPGPIGNMLAQVLRQWLLTYYCNMLLVLYL